jgi:hypothetical protein
MASSVQTVAEALRAQLEAITVAAGYVFTPTAVKVVSFWPDAKALDPSLEVIYLVRPGLVDQRPLTGCSVDERAEFFVLCAARFTEATENPFLAEPVRWQMASDMAADVTAKIRSDVRLGLPSLVLDSWAESISMDFDRYEPGWALVELRLTVRFQYGQSSR